MLARAVRSAAESAGLELFACSRADLDVTDGQAVLAKIRRIAPAAVINCAAWTDVDEAERAEEQATRVNGAGAGILARAAAATGAWMVHVSTDYVFDGAKRTPYVESDRPAPLSAYGRSKLAGEIEVARGAPGAHTVVRTSWLFGAGGRSFPQTILRLLAERSELTVVDDQLGCPTFTDHLAPSLVELATEAAMVGVVHIAGGGACTWCQFAQAIVQEAGLEAEIKPGRTADMDRPAPRPLYSVLRSERPQVPELAHWREGLEAFIAAGARAG